MRHATTIWLYLRVTAAVSIVAMVTGALRENHALTILAGSLFAVAAAAAGWRFAALDPAAGGGDKLAARFARLIALTWGWAGAAMLGCYYLTDLSWQHAWQYGAGMVLIAGLVSAYAHERAQPDTRFAEAGRRAGARWMTWLQGYAALAGVVILALSGKLDAAKQDWAANVVFVAGGLAIFAVSMAALSAERRAGGAALD